MPKCKDCLYYALPPEENGQIRPGFDLSIKAACFANAPYPNCGTSGRLTRPVVYACEPACTKFSPRLEE